jgi:hypothetical protein
MIINEKTNAVTINKINLKIFISRIMNPYI